MKDEIYVRDYFCRCDHCGNITKRLKCQSCGAPVLNREYEEEGFRAKSWNFDSPYHWDGGVSTRGTFRDAIWRH